MSKKARKRSADSWASSVVELEWKLQYRTEPGSSREAVVKTELSNARKELERFWGWRQTLARARSVHQEALSGSPD